MTQIFIIGLLLVILGMLAALLVSEKGRRDLGLSLQSLWLHKLRSFLSVLGIIIGTGAVIILMAFGQGSMRDALDDIQRQGATNIIIKSVKPPDDSDTQKRMRVALYGLTYDDYARLQTIESVTHHVPMRIFAQEIRNHERRITGRVVATTPEYATVNKVHLTAGRFLDEDDDHYMENVVVLGSKIADALFPFDNPIGQSVRLDKYFYKVVGVLTDRLPTGSSGSGQAAEDFNNDAYIPLQTCKVRYGERIFIRTPGSMTGEQVELSQVTLTVKDMDSVRAAGSVVHDLLESYHLKPDWKVDVPLDRLEAAERERDRFSILLAWIAGISLLVGGIGIMNIMLATVTERTREIGIRRALGAKRRDITLQFLIEAIAQTSLGGMIGVVVGLAVVFLIPPVWKWISGSVWPVELNVDSIFYSVGVSIFVGVVFGLYPARRAALLDPIEALRHE